MTRVLSRDRVEARFGAMGKEARVVVLGGPPRADERVRHLLEVLERKWSRFRSGSEIARVNEAAGRGVVVSPETYGLVARAVGAWRATGGRYDPSVPAATGRAAPSPMPGTPGPGCGRVELDPRHRSVRVPAGVHLDLAGVASGFAIDLAIGELVRAGAGGALVGLGADVRVAGDPPRPEGWFVDVDDPFRPGRLGRLRLRSGAVATWPTRAAGPGGPSVPREPAEPGGGTAAVVVASTVVAGEVWWAHALAAAAVAAGDAAGVRLLAEQGVTGLVVRGDGEVVEAPGLSAFS